MADNLQWFWAPSVDCSEPTGQEAKGEQWEQVHDQGVYSEHGDDETIVSRKVICTILYDMYETTWLRSVGCEIWL